MRTASILFLQLLLSITLCQAPFDPSTFVFDPVVQPVIKDPKELRAETVRVYDITQQMAKEIAQPEVVPPISYFPLPPIVPALIANQTVPNSISPVNVPNTTIVPKEEKIVQSQKTEGTKRLETKNNGQMNVTLPPLISNSSVDTTATKPADSTLTGLKQNTTVPELPTQPINTTPTLPPQPSNQVITPLTPLGNPTSIPTIISNVSDQIKPQPTLTPFLPKQITPPPLINNPSPPTTPLKENTFQSLNRFQTSHKDIPKQSTNQMLSQKPHDKVPQQKQLPKESQSWVLTVLLLGLIILTIGTVFGVGCLVFKRRRTDKIKFFDSSVIREQIQTPKLSQAAPYNETENNFSDMVEDYDATHND